MTNGGGPGGPPGARSRSGRGGRSLLVMERRPDVHDLKNPLSAILANCQYLMVHGTLTSEDRQVVGDIASSAKALRELVDRLRTR